MEREMSQRVIVSGCRRLNPAVLLAGVMLLAIYAAYEDLTSDGLRGTQAFLLLGYVVYPLFYGACLFVAWKALVMYRKADFFVCIDGSNLLVWNKKLPLREISSVSIKPGVLLEWLIIRLDDGSETKVSSLALAQPVSEVAARVEAEAGVS